MKKVLVCLLFFTVILTSCSLNDSKESKNSGDNDNSIEDTNNVDKSQNITSTDDEIDNDSSNTEGTTENSDDNSSKSSEVVSGENISEEVKNYILNGQSDKSEAEKLKWSTTFLNSVDINSVYSDYLASGGKAGDVESFADYLTLNAPILSNWEELFKKDLLDAYGVEVTKIEQIDDNIYQAYINNDGTEVPYVAVNARTGYYHG